MPDQSPFTVDLRDPEQGPQIDLTQLEVSQRRPSDGERIDQAISEALDAPPVVRDPSYYLG